MSLPAGTIHIGGIACTPDGAVYVEPTGSASITGTASTGFPVLLAQSYTAVSGAADTNENAIVTIPVAAGMLGSNGGLRLRFHATFTNNANNKVWRVRYSGAAGTEYYAATLTTQQGITIEIVLGNRGVTNSQVGNATGVTISGALQAQATDTSTVDTTAATTLLITCAKASAGDAATVEWYTCEYIKASNA
jgi:hypothetical protein